MNAKLLTVKPDNTITARRPINGTKGAKTVRERSEMKKGSRGKKA
jgi:hypothetical protein